MWWISYQKNRSLPIKSRAQLLLDFYVTARVSIIKMWKKQDNFYLDLHKNVSSLVCIYPFFSFFLLFSSLLSFFYVLFSSPPPWYLPFGNSRLYFGKFWNVIAFIFFYSPPSFQGPVSTSTQFFFFSFLLLHLPSSNWLRFVFMKSRRTFCIARGPVQFLFFPYRSRCCFFFSRCCCRAHTLRW